MFRVKICGVTGARDARLCVEAGADAVGLNFYPPSPRRVEMRTAEELAAAADKKLSKLRAAAREAEAEGPGELHGSGEPDHEGRKRCLPAV